MFFHHLTARVFNEIDGILLPAAPVLSVLEKLRIDALSSALTADALDEKKRKRSTSIDILIQSSLYLSMTSRESVSSGDEELKEGEVDGNVTEGEREEGDVGEGEDEVEEEGDEYIQSNLYSSSSKYKNHSPFSTAPYNTYP